jgi:hypothetical protein
VENVEKGRELSDSESFRELPLVEKLWKNTVFFPQRLYTYQRFSLSHQVFHSFSIDASTGNNRLR